MKGYERQIQKYKDSVQELCAEQEGKQRAVSVCRQILTEQVMQQQSSRASYFEFLYEQSGFIKKRWWILQGGALWYLWFWLNNYGTDFQEMMRIMGIFATVFVILIIPEIWKNRRNGSIEVEQASYYTLRQICAARILLFAVVDFGIVMLFLLATYSTASIPLYDLIIHFLLPVNVSCCICFRLLYSRWGKTEYPAIFLCLVWVGIWTMLVSDDVIYQKIVEPVWVVMLLLSFAYFVFCVHRSLKFDEKILEGCTDEVRI